MSKLTEFIEISAYEGECFAPYFYRVSCNIFSNYNINLNNQIFIKRADGSGRQSDPLQYYFPADPKKLPLLYKSLFLRPALAHSTSHSEAKPNQSAIRSLLLFITHPLLKQTDVWNISMVSGTYSSRSRLAWAVNRQPSFRPKDS